ncbi:MAG: ABC transporter ATP-binding protein [Xanthobacteraceae bacterium]
MSLLRLKNVSRVFGKLVALQDIDLEMEEGKVYAMIGPNGAGKTTLFNLISGFFQATTGQIWFDDKLINDFTAEKRVAAGLVRTFQITEVFPELSVAENIRIGVEAQENHSAHVWPSAQLMRQVNGRVDELLQTAGLTQQADHIVSELAHGDQRVVEVAMALSMKPKLLLLDEPTAGMGRAEAGRMVDLIRTLHDKEHLSILFVEHDMDIVFGVADRIVVLNFGKTLAMGTPKEIAQNPAVQAAYLGDPA